MSRFSARACGGRNACARQQRAARELAAGTGAGARARARAGSGAAERTAPCAPPETVIFILRLLFTDPRSDHGPQEQ
ncbi:hypothetical protein AGIG_G14709 [Arapaima gigas]